MRIEVRHAVLHVVDMVGGRPNGKTYIQKMCFFVSKLLNEPMGFQAHYYGPYSDQVSAELASLTGAGLLAERRKGSGARSASGWEIARFDYSLTDEGKDAVAYLNTKFPAVSRDLRAAIQRVLDAGDLDYVGLSFAAKTRWILDVSGGPMTTAGVAQAAGKFNWNVEQPQVEAAASFLEKLGLVTLSKSQHQGA